MSASTIQLDRLSQSTELFRLFNNGKHLNRLAEPALWAEFEREEAAYRALFAALGYQLRVDGRGFAWFHTEDASSNVNKATRQLALLFMVIFDTQADAGKALLRFGDWVIDRPLLSRVHEQHQELLTSEGLDVDGLLGLLDSASRFGFARAENGRWQLLPAVCRYLDHFEALAEYRREDSQENSREDHREDSRDVPAADADVEVEP